MPVSDQKFNNIKIHTQYSICEGAIKIDELAEYCKSNKIKSNLGGSMLEKYFNYKKNKTDFKTEVIAGVTTFLTMAYIMFLNPFILSGEFAGPEKGFFDFGAVYTAKLLRQLLRVS